MKVKTNIPPSLRVLALDVQINPEKWRAHYFLSGEVFIKEVFKKLRTFLANRLGYIPAYNYVWLTTEVGVAIAFSGSKFALQLLPDFFEWCIEQQHVGKAMCGYLGWSKAKSTQLLNETLKVYAPIPNTRSYGGTLRQENE
ncbi:hypothetical protein [Pseudomonas sp. LFM046]|uniref:hypothetical protein n=1 Tax=Pseudomonas sp. LFM046 TaxID=1608357 RepID=UPI0011AF3EFA|nr:hypothetical protein [Pseudomonas sp. LFM046]